MSDAVNKILWRSLIILAVVTIVTSYFSVLFYFPDEHFQILEFMSTKLGITRAHDLPWEYRAQIRPWLQPFLYTMIARALMAFGQRDLFNIVFVLRLVTGLFSVAALALFARQLLATLHSDEEKRAYAGYLPLFGFLPYLFVRTASETLSAAFFTLALATAMRSRSARSLAAAGLLCALAFDSRYQSGLLAAGLMAWLIIIAKVRLKPLAAFVGGGLAGLGIGALADRWGYGVWVFPPLGYFRVNIIQGVAAKSFGADPVFAYLYMIPAQIFFAITLVLMAAMTLMWLRNPRHVVSWVTPPFVMVHVALAHKEPRFLFPLALLATAFPVLGFSPALPRWRAMFARVWGWRRSVFAKTITGFSVTAMLFLAFYPMGVRPHMPMARYLYRHGGGTVYTFDQPLPYYPMFTPAGLRTVSLHSPAELDALLAKGPVTLMSASPTLAIVLPAHVRATLLFSEFPPAAFGYGQVGTRFIQNYRVLAMAAPWLKLLPLYWYTLYRLDRPATMAS